LENRKRDRKTTISRKKKRERRFGNSPFPPPKRRASNHNNGESVWQGYTSTSKAGKRGEERVLLKGLCEPDFLRYVGPGKSPSDSPVKKRVKKGGTRVR